MWFEEPTVWPPTHMNKCLLVRVFVFKSTGGVNDRRGRSSGCCGFVKGAQMTNNTQHRVCAPQALYEGAGPLRQTLLPSFGTDNTRACTCVRER